ncbi:MAG: hypothetical protein KJN93_07750 [Alphaproteobacteria bacterium]|nr:hypothetical protein [Alphaproteobacteria bacterium]NNF25324.1 hypothetical protein [Paracoccaceae bacterium]
MTDTALSPRFLSIYRRDKKNVGDLWSVPQKFFPLRGVTHLDLAEPDSIPNEPGVYVVGGGGLGRAGFQSFLDRLTRKDRKYTLIAWGVGADTALDKAAVFGAGTEAAAPEAYFSSFDAVGTRIWRDAGYREGDIYDWVPCASCMSELFLKLRDTRPTRKLGIYEHLRVPLASRVLEGQSPLAQIPGLGPLFSRAPVASNRGADLAEKLEFMARHEVIATNSYHGVYWATLLGRKVLCYPFKDGLFTFRHAPSYPGEEGLEAAMDRARAYPEALDDCRAANIAFYHKMQERFGDF